RWRLEVEYDRLLAAVDAGEIGRLAALERAVLPGVVAALRRLDLDHPRAELGQQQRAIRAGENARQIDDENAGKRPSLCHASSPSGAGAPSIAQRRVASQSRKTP